MQRSSAVPAISKSPETGDEYLIPDVIDAAAEIEQFLRGNAGKRVVIVQGLGFVGAVMSIVCANALTEEYAVIGVDLPTPESYWKIRSINDGILPLSSSDPKVSEYFEEARRKGNLMATADPTAYSHADVIIVDVNLDVAKESGDAAELRGFDVDLEPFSNAIRAIGKHCRPDVLVLVETTVPPGTCSQVVAPLLREELAARGQPTGQFRLGHSYERVMPGPNYVDSIQNFYRVYSGVDDASADTTRDFLQTVIRTDEYPLTRLASTNATEMAKVLENSYRAMNIAFIVEWSRFAEEADVNLYEVVQAIRMRPTHSNMMLPGIGVGGYCLTKDPLLASWSRTALFGASEELTQSVEGVRINDRMPLHAFEYLKESLGTRVLSDLRVLLLGVSYRGDVGDTRYSPVELFSQLLESAGCDVVAHDYFVNFWPERDMPVETDLAAALASKPQVIAVTTGHSAYRDNAELRDWLAAADPILMYDTLGLLSDAELDQFGKSHQVLVLGRGGLDRSITSEVSA